MAKMIPQTAPPVPAEAYTPVTGDFEYLDRSDILTDTNYASLSYWKGVFIHFFKNRRAVIGLIIIAVIILLAVFGPMMNSYGYRDIVQFRNESNRRVVAKALEPRVPWLPFRAPRRFTATSSF